MKFFTKKSGTLHQLCSVLFRISAFVFGILLVVEIVIPGFVTSWFNPIWLLIIAVISGIISTIDY